MTKPDGNITGHRIRDMKYNLIAVWLKRGAIPTWLRMPGITFVFRPIIRAPRELFGGSAFLATLGIKTGVCELQNIGPKRDLLTRQNIDDRWVIHQRLSADRNDLDPFWRRNAREIASTLLFTYGKVCE